MARVGDLKAFHERLGGDDFCSYSAVRNYHHVDDRRPDQEREAPARYLARVAGAFRVDPGWLLTGEGEPTVAKGAEAEVLRRIGQRFSDGLTDHLARSFGHSLPEGAEPAFWRTFGAFTSHFTSEDPDELVGDGIARLAAAYRAPLASLSIEPSTISDDALTDYIDLMSHALRRIIPTEEPNDA